MSDHSFRPAEPEDAGAIQRVAEASWHAAHDQIVGAGVVDEFLAEHYDQESITAGISDDETAFRVAQRGSEVVGFGVGVPHDDTTWGPAAIYVHPDEWGDGVGTALLDAVERAARAAGARRLRLVVLSDNTRACRFYEYRGYEAIEEESDGELGAAETTYVRELS